MVFRAACALPVTFGCRLEVTGRGRLKSQGSIGWDYCDRENSVGSAAGVVQCGGGCKSKAADVKGADSKQLSLECADVKWF